MTPEYACCCNLKDNMQMVCRCGLSGCCFISMETRVLTEMGESSVGRKSALGASLRSDSGQTNFYAKPGIMPIFDSTESLDSSRRSSQNVKIRHIHRFLDLSRFPKLDECAHFHYDVVEINTITLSLVVENQENVHQHDDRDDVVFYINVTSNGRTWTIRRTYDNFRSLDKQLHKCIYDRKYSQLPEIPKGGAWLEMGSEYVQDQFASYMHRLSQLAGPMINCGPVLNWIQMDNRGNRLMISSESAINTPAIGAAHVVKRYNARAQDELSFEVGDIISVIDMPPPEDTTWWRGKRGFEVGYFPSECIEMIGDTVPQEMASRIPQTPPKAVLRKRGKLISFLRTFFVQRPERNVLKQNGIFIERVFGCDLGEHLLNTGQEVPMVLKCCADFIETHGIVDGIYRLSGVASNIQRLRQVFDDDEEPDLNSEEYVQDVHCISSLLKLYFRELPNPLLTYQLYDKFADAVQDEENKLMRVHDAVQQLPPPHYRTSQYLFRHLAKVAVHGGGTGMHPKNLAIVWAPNLLRSKELESGCGAAALQGVGLQAVVTEFLIRYADIIFSDKLPAFGASDRLGTKRTRPKSLAISTPTKLLSLEEAREKALYTGTSPPDKQKFIDVGGGPQGLPDKYHTVIDLPGRKRPHSLKGKKNQPTSSWKNFFLRSKAQNKTKGRKGSIPTQFYSTTDKALTEEDLAFRRRLRATKSVDSIISLSPISPKSKSSSSSSNPYSEDGSPLGTFLIAQEAAQIAAKTNLMTKLEEKMCDNIDSQSPDMALLSTSAPVMLMSPLENFLVDDIQSFSWSESSSEHRSPIAASPLTVKKTTSKNDNEKSNSCKSSPVVSPGRRSQRSSSNSSVHRRNAGSSERLKGSFGKLTRSPSDEIFPMEMTESYGNDDVLMVSVTKHKTSSSSSSSKERLDGHNSSFDDVPGDVCTQGLYRQRSSSYQSALSDNGAVVEVKDASSSSRTDDLRTPDSLTQTPQLDSDLDLTNIIDRIFTFSSSVNHETASSEFLSSMADSEFTNRDSPPYSERDGAAEPNETANGHIYPDAGYPLRKSRSYERAISDDVDEDVQVTANDPSVTSEDVNEFHTLEPVLEEKSRTPSSEKEFIIDFPPSAKDAELAASQATAPPLPMRSPDVAGIPLSDQERLEAIVGNRSCDSPSSAGAEFVEHQTPYIHIIERLTSPGAILLPNSGESEDNEIRFAKDFETGSNRGSASSEHRYDEVFVGDTISLFGYDRETESDMLSLEQSAEEPHYVNVATTVSAGPRIGGGGFNDRNLEAEPSDYDSLNGDYLAVNLKLSSRMLMTPDNMSLSPSEEDHFRLMYSLASTPSMGTLCSQTDGAEPDPLRQSQSHRDFTQERPRCDAMSRSVFEDFRPSDMSVNDIAPSRATSDVPPPLPVTAPPDVAAVVADPPSSMNYSEARSSGAPETLSLTFDSEPCLQSVPSIANETSACPALYSGGNSMALHEKRTPDEETFQPISFPGHNVTAHASDTKQTFVAYDEASVETKAVDNNRAPSATPAVTLTPISAPLADVTKPPSRPVSGATSDRSRSSSFSPDETTPTKRFADVIGPRGWPFASQETRKSLDLTDSKLESMEVQASHMPKASSSELVPKRDSAELVPKRDSNEFLAKRDSTEFIPKRDSTELSSKRSSSSSVEMARGESPVAYKMDNSDATLKHSSMSEHNRTMETSSKPKESLEDTLERLTSDSKRPVTGSSTKRSVIDTKRVSRGLESASRETSSEPPPTSTETVPARTVDTTDNKRNADHEAGTPVKRKKSVKELTSRFEPEPTERTVERSSKSPARESENKERPRSVIDRFERQTSLEKVAKQELPKGDVRSHQSPGRVEINRSTPTAAVRPSLAKTPENIAGVVDKAVKQPSPENVHRSSPEASKRPISNIPLRSPPVAASRVTKRISPEVVGGRSPDTVKRLSGELVKHTSPVFPRQTTAASVKQSGADVLKRTSPEVVNRPTPINLSDTPKWTPQWTPRKDDFTMKTSQEMELSSTESSPPTAQTKQSSTEPNRQSSETTGSSGEITRPSLEKRPSRLESWHKPSLEHRFEPETQRSPEEKTPSPVKSPVKELRMPMLSNRFRDRPDLFALAAKYRDPPEPTPLSAPEPEEPKPELPKTDRIPLLDRRRSLKSPEESKDLLDSIRKVSFTESQEKATPKQPTVAKKVVDEPKRTPPPVSPKTWVRKETVKDEKKFSSLEGVKRLSGESEAARFEYKRSFSVPRSDDDEQDLDERRSSCVKRFSLSGESETETTATPEPESAVAASLFGVKLRKTKRGSVEGANVGMDVHRQSGEFRQSWVSST